MKSALPILACLLISAAPAQGTSSDSAQPPVSRAVAQPSEDAMQLGREFLAIIVPPASQEQAFLDEAKTTARSRIAERFGQALDPAVDELLDRVVVALLPTIRQSLPAVNEAYATAYARRYSVDELRQLIAFASSPIGQRLFRDSVTVLADPDVLAANKQMTDNVTNAIEHVTKVAACQQATAKRIAAGDVTAKCPFA